MSGGVGGTCVCSLCYVLSNDQCHSTSKTLLTYSTTLEHSRASSRACLLLSQNPPLADSITGKKSNQENWISPTTILEITPFGRVSAFGPLGVDAHEEEHDYSASMTDCSASMHPEYVR